MPFTMTAAHGKDFLLVEGAGLASLDDLCALFDFARASAGNRGQKRAVIDLRKVDIDFKFTDHLALGAHAANELRGMDRVASIVNAKYRVGTSEKAAQKMGLPLRTFTDYDEGLAWVMQP